MTAVIKDPEFVLADSKKMLEEFSDDVHIPTKVKGEILNNVSQVS